MIEKNGDSAGGETGPGRFVDSESRQLPPQAGCLALAASVVGEKLPASYSGSRKRGETDRDAELVGCGRFQAHRAGPARGGKFGAGGNRIKRHLGNSAPGLCPTRLRAGRRRGPADGTVREGTAGI